MTVASIVGLYQAMTTLVIFSRPSLLRAVAETLSGLFRRPPPSREDMVAVKAFLRHLDSEGGFVVDGDENAAPEIVWLACRLGLASFGSGWNVGVSITQAGQDAIQG